jgi:hypothetical protein
MMSSAIAAQVTLHWPAVWNSQFDNKGHQKERAGGQSPEDYEDRKEDFRPND